MWYRLAARGYIRFEKLADHLADMLFPTLNDLRKSEEFKNLDRIYDQFTKTKDQSEKIKIFLSFKQQNDKFQSYMAEYLQDLFNQVRFEMMRAGFNTDFDIDIITGISGADYTAAYSPGRMIINLYEVDKRKKLARDLEHEIIHMHQLAYKKNQPYSEEELPKIKQKLEGNYFDIKEEGQAFVSNIMRELPSLSSKIEKARLHCINNPNYSYRDCNSVAEEYIHELLSNNQNFISYLQESKTFRTMMYGNKEKSPMLNEKRRNKVLSVLHHAITEEARKILSTI